MGVCVAHDDPAKVELAGPVRLPLDAARALDELCTLLDRATVEEAHVPASDVTKPRVQPINFYYSEIFCIANQRARSSPPLGYVPPEVFSTDMLVKTGARPLLSGME